MEGEREAEGSRRLLIYAAGIAEAEWPAALVANPYTTGCFRWDIAHVSVKRYGNVVGVRSLGGDKLVYDVS